MVLILAVSFVPGDTGALVSGDVKYSQAPEYGILRASPACEETGTDEANRKALPFCANQPACASAKVFLG
jgi:hypothetical protein